MGVGKTVVGRALAVRLGLPFVDTDVILAERHGPVGAQVRTDEAGFRVREAALIRELATDGVARVVATGGGTVEAGDAWDVLRAHFRTIWLDAPLEVSEARVAGTDRPAWDRHVVERWARRRARWLQSTVRVDATSPLDIVVGRAARGSAAARFVHHTTDGPCPVQVSETLDGLRDLVRAVAPGPVVLVTDETVAACWGDRVRAVLGGPPTLTLPAGEAHKTVATWSRLLDELLALGVTRDTTVVALGGGVVGDVAGFAASAALRGLPVVQLPTTLLAMVDAALGGKTAVDHPRGKNLVGAFHPPVAVGVWPGFLETLPPRERASGYAEVVKTALIAGPALFDRLGDPVGVDLVARCLEVKAAIVERDPWDRGVRLLLNAGHTVGHAIEQAHGFGVWTHGEAVAAGLVVEAEYAVRAGVCRDETLPDRLRTVLRRAGLPVALPAGSREQLLAALALDKKGRADTIRVPLPVVVGELSVVDVPRTELGALIAGATP
jgi:shikimate kinase/3-dehydroquinate synthase